MKAKSLCSGMAKKFTRISPFSSVFSCFFCCADDVVLSRSMSTLSVSSSGSDNSDYSDSFSLDEESEDSPRTPSHSLSRSHTDSYPRNRSGFRSQNSTPFEHSSSSSGTKNHMNERSRSHIEVVDDTDERNEEQDEEDEEKIRNGSASTGSINNSNGDNCRTSTKISPKKISWKLPERIEVPIDHSSSDSEVNHWSLKALCCLQNKKRGKTGNKRRK